MIMNFNGDTAELNYTISDADMNFMQDYLPTNMDGQTVIKFKVYARIIGSNTEGMLAGTEALSFHEFELVLLDTTAVE